MNLNRIIVLGNSGSGKSWIAKNLASAMNSEWIDLDTIHWEPGGYGVARDRLVSLQMAKQHAENNKWVIEGIYGWIIEEIQIHATYLVWLKINELECIENIKSRGIRGNGTEESFSALLNWAGSYKTRTGSSSFDGHQAIFNKFSGNKITLTSRTSIDEFLSSIGSKI